MNKPHKHAEMIKAWADGATIQIRNHGDVWYTFPPGVAPIWEAVHEYRVKPQPHKWQKEMDAQAAGKAVQGRYPGDPWTDGTWEFNSDNLEYRIKPEEEYRYAKCSSTVTDTPVWTRTKCSGDNVMATFLEGKLIKVEVL
jgi:hypothetical protein